MIRLAIPNKGRIVPDIIRLLEKIGLEISENGRKLYANTNNPNIQVLYTRAADIPFYVEAGAADLGVTGEDMISESGVQVKKLLKLNFGGCKIVVASLSSSKIKSPKDYLGGLRVATNLVNTTIKYFNARGVDPNIIRLSGAIELAPNLGIADVIVDQVSTGTTLVANNLSIVDTISESSICLIANAKSLREKEKEVDELKLSMEGVVIAEGKRYIMANVVSDDDLKRVIEVMPCMESPTVLELSREGEYAVHSVIDSIDLIPTIRKLKEAGAKDILVMNVSRVVE
ncbi:MAG: ATP phosphoribosyltransferase [Candidatus Micrarchaeota archaeon]